MAHHTHTDTCTQRHTQTDTDTIFTFYTFSSFGIHAKYTNFIFGIPQTYPCTDTQTCTHIDMHLYRDIDTQIQIHTDTCMFVYIHKHTHTDMHVGSLRKLLVQIHFKSKLTKIVTLNMKFEVIVT